MMVAPLRSGDNGFALVETLAATAIVALMTGVAFHAMNSSALTARTVNERRTAILIARSAIANSDADAVGRADGRSGQSGRLTWRVTVSAYGDDARAVGPLLQRVTADVSVTATGRRVVSLQTLRLPR